MAKLPAGRFPFINLTKALERARLMFDNDKGGKGLRIPVAFAAWSYSEKSSGAFQTVGALKAYGLLVDEGANSDRLVKLTSDARKYFQTEIEDEKAAMRAKFAARPPLMAHLLEHWEGGVVDDPVARTYLKTDIGMSDQSARSALGIYKENLSHSLSKPHQEISEILPEFPEPQSRSPTPSVGGVQIGDTIDWEVSGTVKNASPMRVVGLSDDKAWVFVAENKMGLPIEQVIVRGKSPELSPAPINPFLNEQIKQDFSKPVQDGYRSETFDTDEGTITITWPSDLSPQSVEDMKDWLELLKRRIERRART